MNLTKSSTTDLSSRNAVKAAKRAQAAGSAAAANATSAAENAAVAAQHAVDAAQVAARNAAVAATNAAHNAGDAAQMAATGLSKNMKDRVYNARVWAAPRLESAADYTTSTVAPRVSAALRSTAGKVNPVDTTDSRRKVLTWSLLGAAILAGLGAGAALVRVRYRAAIAADSEAADEEDPSDSGDQATSADPNGSKPRKPTDPGADSSTSDRVRASGW